MSLSVLSLQVQFQQHMLGTADATGLITGSAARQGLGLGIYAHAYRARLLDTLADAYQKTQAVLGEGAFKTAALAYIDAHPPTTRSLRWYGDQFEAHLARHHADQPTHAEIAASRLGAAQGFRWPPMRPRSTPVCWVNFLRTRGATLRLVPVPTTELSGVPPQHRGGVAGIGR